jgi:hypothetical protein
MPLFQIARPYRVVALAFALGIAVADSGRAAQAIATPTDAATTEEFLLKGKVLRTRGAGKGITGSLRATLTDGTLTHDAQIQAVDETKQQFTSAKGTEFNFRDSWTYNVAAYRLSRLIGLDMVPVSVERTWNGQPAAFTWWVDGVLMDEGQRLKDKVQPPRPTCWLEQMHLVRMFDELIENTDRNLGNILYTKDWRIWAIDHTRAFRRSPEPRKLAELTRIDRGVFQRLQALEFAAVKREIGRYLPDSEIRVLLSRRDKIVAHFAARGEGAFFDRSDPARGCL